MGYGTMGPDLVSLWESCYRFRAIVGSRGSMNCELPLPICVFAAEVGHFM